MTSLKKVGSNNWIDSDFCVPEASKTNKKRAREHNNNNNNLAVRKKPYLMPPDQELWINKHRPEAAESLAVNNKKVEEVRSWLLDHGQSGGILLLTGPAGAGKTATVSVLATELDMDLQEWVNPVDQISYGDTRTVLEEGGYYRPDDTVAYSSQSRQFGDWLRGGKYKSLVMDSEGRAKSTKLLMVEDMPSFALSKTSEFISILETYSRTQPKHPLVFICSDASGSRESALRQIFKPEPFTRLNIRTVAMNACTTTNLVKVLTKIATQESLCGYRQFRVPDKSALEMLAESTGGDIRSSINALQFSCLQNSTNTTTTSYSDIFQGDNLALASSKKSTKHKSSVKSGRAAVGGKDQSLVLFHGLGKVLYAKRAVTGPPEPFPLPAALERHRRHPLIAQPEAVLEQTAISKDAFSCFLHQNYLAFYSDIADISRLSHYFSEGDLLLQEWGLAGRMDTTEYGGSLLARAVMFSNQHPAVVSGMRKLTKPELYGVNRRRDNNLYSIRTALPASTQSRTEVMTVTVPLLAKLGSRSSRIQQTSLLAITDVGRMSCNRTPSAVPQSGQPLAVELDFFTEDEEEDRQLLQQCLSDQPQADQQLQQDQEEEFIIEEFED